MTAPLALQSGAFAVDIHPAMGGAIGRFAWRRSDGTQVDILRPASKAAIRAGNSGGASCFPLFPYSNRIRDCRFRFNGEEIVLARNTPGPHVEHGHGWQRRWTVIASNSSSATIGFKHDPEHDTTWPFAYAAEQHFFLDAKGLSIRLTARNLDKRSMPVGFGLHPYFPLTPGSRLQADVKGFWETDAEVLPTSHGNVPARFDPANGLMMNEVAIDNVFTGFQGHATVTWPEHRTRVNIVASDPLRFLVVYAPDAATRALEMQAGSAPYFCVEPVSNVTDAFNLANRNPRIDTGLITLAPGTSASAHLRLFPEPA